MATYDIGEQVRLTAHFTDIDGLPSDPTVVACKVRSPSGTWTDLVAIQKIGTGHYQVDFTVTSSGEWHFRWTGAGSLVVAEEDTLFVRRSYV